MFCHCGLVLLQGILSSVAEKGLCPKISSNFAIIASDIHFRRCRLIVLPLQRSSIVFSLRVDTLFGFRSHCAVHILAVPSSSGAR